MTEKEICRMYSQAKHRGEQILIISQLTGLSVHKIVMILLENGERVRYPIPAPGNKRKEELTDEEYTKALFKRLDHLDKLIFRYTQEYKDIAAVMRGCVDATQRI